MSNKIKKVELVLKKINYLFESIDASPEQSSSLEMALLKRYSIDLYDAIIENEALAASATGIHINKESSTAGVIPLEIDTGDNTVEAESQEEIKEEVTEDLTNILEEVKRKSEIEQQNNLAGLNNGLNVEPGFVDLNTNLGIADAPKEPVIQEERETVMKTIMEPPTPTSKIEAEPEITEIIEKPTIPAEEVIETPIQENIVEEDIYKEEELTLDEILANNTSDETSIDTFDSPTMEVKEEPSFEAIEEEEIIEEIIPDEPAPKVFDILEENIAQKSTPSTTNNFVDEGKTDVLTNIAQKVRLNQTPIFDRPAEVNNNNFSDLGDTGKETQLLDKLRMSAGGSKKSFNVNYNQRYAFISDLFKGDAAVYDQTLEELGKCKNVIEAFTYLNLHVKIKYDWKDDAPLVKEFQQIVKDKFLSED